MPPPSAQFLLGHIHDLVGPRSAHEANDENCLQRFILTGDEASFAILVRRHGPMVLGTCRRALQDNHLAEDVTQAVFLVLACKAASVRKGRSLGCWLYGVAYRLAQRAKAEAARRREHEARAFADRPCDRSADTSWRETLELLDEELSRLSDSFQAPLVLCYLEGRTRDEAARQLGWSLRTLDRRLERGRAILRDRLLRRGVELGSVLLGLALTRSAVGANGAVLTAAARAATKEGVAVAARVAALAESVIREMAMRQLKVALAVALTACFVMVSVAVGARHFFPSQQAEPRAEKPTPEKPKTPTDRYGDPLPADALVRLGTVRMRHDIFTRCAAFTADSKTVIVGDGNGHIVFWDTATGKEVRRVRALGHSLGSLAMSADGKKLVTGGYGKLEMWDPATGDLIKGWVVESDVVTQIELSPTGSTAAVRYQKKIIDLWDTATGQRLHRLEGHSGIITSIALSPDGTMLASAAWQDRNIRLWDVASGKEVRTIVGAKLEMVGVAFSPDGKTLAACGNGEPVRFWDRATGQLRFEGDARYAAVTNLSYLPDGKNLVGLWTTKVVIWDAATGKVLRKSEDEPRDRSHLAVSPDGKMIATSWGGPNAFDLWDAATLKLVHGFEGHRQSVTALAFAIDGKTLFSGSGYLGEPLIQWDLSSGKPARRLGKYPTGAKNLALSPDGRLLAACDFNQSICLWNLKTGQEVRRLKGNPDLVDLSVSFSEDGKTLASGSRIWDVATGKELRSIPVEQEWPCPMVMSPDGKMVAVGGFRGGAVRMWDTATGKELRDVSTRNSLVYTVAFSPDGKYLATGGDQGPVCLWDWATGVQIREFGESADWVYRVAFSTDGRTLASAGRDGQVSLWEVAMGGQRAKFSGHQGAVQSLNFSTDGRRLASGGVDTTVLVWDVAGPGDVAKEMNALWDDLSGKNVAAAHKAFWKLTATPNKAVPFLEGKVKPAAPPTAETRQRVTALLAKLDSEEFAERSTASTELEKLDLEIEPLVRQALKGELSAEVRGRVRKILERIESASEAEWVNKVRVLEVLEHIGTPEARVVLERYAGGEPTARFSLEAKATLNRLNRYSQNQAPD